MCVRATTSAVVPQFPINQLTLVVFSPGTGNVDPELGNASQGDSIIKTAGLTG